MASHDAASRRIQVVWVGHPLGGKTTTLAWLQEHLPYPTSELRVDQDLAERRVTLDVELEAFPGGPAVLQLSTLPGAVYYKSAWRKMLSSADTIVCLVESRRDRLDGNLLYMQDCLDYIEDCDRTTGEFGWVYQWNQRDLDPAAMWTLEELQDRFNPTGAPAVPTCATTGEGLLECFATLKEAVAQRTRRYLSSHRA